MKNLITVVALVAVAALAACAQDVYTPDAQVGHHKLWPERALTPKGR